MFQTQNILFSKKGFDDHILTNYVHFNYYNKYNRFIYKVSKIQKKEPRLVEQEPNIIYDTISNIVQKISTPVGSPEETSYLIRYKERPKKDDIGWSCSIKSVQMLLAFYFKKWGIESNIIPNLYKEKGVLSIHSFIRKCIQDKCNEQAGDYFGVFTVIQIFKKIIYTNNVFKLPYDHIHITTDNIIDIDSLNRKNHSILIYSTRLGIDKLDPYYKEMILNMFKCKHFDGMLGGVSKSCYYFIARHTHLENLIYLDPHFITDYNDNINLCDLKDTNYISTNIDNLNPSLTFCFSYRTEKEFLELKKFLEKNTIFNILHKNYGKTTIQPQSYNTQNKTNEPEWEIF
jgi:hypothetical protein